MPYQVRLEQQDADMHALVQRDSYHALGLQDYLPRLRLEDSSLFDAQGNIFDPAALALRLHGPLTAWAEHRGPLPVTFLHPSRLAEQFTALCARVRQDTSSLPPASPFPSDLHGYLISSTYAAQVGRRAE